MAVAITFPHHPQPRHQQHHRLLQVILIQKLPSSWCCTGSATGPSAKTIPGSIAFDVAGSAAIQALKDDLPKAKIIVLRLIAESTPADITQNMIEIISIDFSAAGGGRRLQDGERITINFKVFVPADSDATFEASDIDSTTFTTRLPETVEEVLGVSGLQVTSALTVDVQDPIPITVEQPTSAAFPKAKLPSSLMVFIIMLAGKQVLAWAAPESPRCLFMCRSRIGRRAWNSLVAQ